MKLLFSISVLLFATLFITSCNPKQLPGRDDKNKVDTLAFIQRGDSISAAVQQVLLANVMQATKTGGPVFAVAFCNVHAMPLTDSLSKKYNCLIQRISDKYRNPGNKPSGFDKGMILKMSSLPSAEPVLISEKGKTVYYKPIRVAIPACLNCHGTEGKDISAKTLEAIRQKYPGDLATGYKEGDFRGMWKITFPEE